MIDHLDVTLLLPLAKVPEGVGVCRLLHPLDHLQKNGIEGGKYTWSLDLICSSFDIGTDCH